MQNNKNYTSLSAKVMVTLLLSLLSLRVIAADILNESFDFQSSWILNGDVKIENSELSFKANHSSTYANYSAIQVPQTYTLTLEAAIKKYSESDKDALGMRIRNGQYVLELRFREEGLFVKTLNKKTELKYDNYYEKDRLIESSTEKLTKVPSGDKVSDELYQAVVKDGVASLYHGNKRLLTFDMPLDNNKNNIDVIQLWSDGITDNYSESKVMGFALTNNDSDYFNVFNFIPEPSYNTEHNGNRNLSFHDKFETDLRRQNNPLFSWSNAGGIYLNESSVFRASLSHKSDFDSQNWEIGIGRGGQIYSFKTTAGELIPPQYHKGAEWIDEVFQVVTANTLTNNRDPIAYSSRNFVHQAGTYWSKSLGQGINKETTFLDPKRLGKSFNSPMLAENFDAKENAYYSLVWGQHSHVPSIYRSKQLFYTKIKDLGDGVIEFTNVITNSGDYTINWLNLPWGGVRKSVLPTQIISDRATESYKESLSNFGQVTYAETKPDDDMGLIDHDKTLGWFAWVNKNKNQGLGLVFGQDQYFDKINADYHWKPSHFKWGYQRATEKDHAVGVNILPVNIEPGQSFYYRYYMVVGSLEHIAEKGTAYNQHVEYGLLDIAENSAATLGFKTKDINGEGELQHVEENPDFSLFADPVKNAEPMFLMQDTGTNAHFVSNNPFEITDTKAYQNPYRVYINETRTSSAKWTSDIADKDVEVSGNKIILRSTNNNDANRAILKASNIPDSFIVGFNAEIKNLTNQRPLNMVISNGKTKLEVLFRNNSLFMRSYDSEDKTKLSWVKLIDGIKPNVDKRYEFLVKKHPKYGKAEGYNYYVAQFIYNGKTLTFVRDGAVNALSLKLPSSQDNSLSFLVSGANITTKVSKLRVEDEHFKKLNKKTTAAAYDGTTRYLGFLGYALPSVRKDEDGYESLTTHFDPSSTFIRNKELKVISGND